MFAARWVGAQALPGGVRVVEVGIAGLHLVQELLGGYDACILLDAVDLGVAPGTVTAFRPEIPDPRALPLREQLRYVADLHGVEPYRALVLARLLGALPSRVLVVGCQPESFDELEVSLSPRVQQAVAAAGQLCLQVIAELRAGVCWSVRYPLVRTGDPGPVAG